VQHLPMTSIIMIARFYGLKYVNGHPNDTRN
jgi:hypothetical protein